MEYHPRSAEPHDFAYLFPHVWTVAMDRAFMAFGFSFTELASVEKIRLKSDNINHHWRLFSVFQSV